ncbi:MAG: hypothetical protein ABIB71_02925 [Candidatus Woesearchaeota archaeon]
MKYLEELKKMKLPENEFAIFGSGPMAIRGIRENKDLDILAKASLWDNLKKQFPVSDNDSIKVGEIEFFREWPFFENPEELIDHADIIDGFRFVKLKDVIKFKQALGREKDQRDIRKIEEFLRK